MILANDGDTVSLSKSVDIIAEIGQQNVAFKILQGHACVAGKPVFSDIFFVVHLFNRLRSIILQCKPLRQKLVNHLLPHPHQ